MEKNCVVVIGNDHINALGVIRTFGENKIFPYLILISNKKKNAITCSKYIKKYWIFDDEEEAIRNIVKLFSDKKNKPIIIATSDKSALALDRHYNELKNNFILHNIDNIENNISFYMDKYNQYKLLKKCNIKCLNSEIVEFNNLDLNNVTYPCIIKPIVSANGDKLDIMICNNISDLELCIDHYKQKGYKEFLIQDYLDYDYEFEITGFRYKGEVCIPGMTQKIRIWPKKKGSTTFGKICPLDPKIKEIIEELLSRLNYSGVFDVELFKINDDYYFNEINFRNSGHSYAYKDNHPAYYWYLSNINKKVIKIPSIMENYYFIDDQAELHQIIEFNISLLQHFKDRKKSKIFLAKNQLDSLPSKKMFIYKIINKIIK